MAEQEEAKVIKPIKHLFVHWRASHYLCHSFGDGLLRTSADASTKNSGWRGLLLGRLRTVRFRAATLAFPPLIRDGAGNILAAAFLPQSPPLM